MDNQNLTNGTSNLGGNTNSPSGLKLEPTEPKRKVNVPAIIFGVTTLLCAGAAIFFGIDYFNSDKGGGEQSGDGSRTVEQDGGSVAVSANNIAQDYNEVKHLMEGFISGEAWGNVQNSYGLTYKPDGANTFMPMKFNLEVEIKSKNGDDVSETTMKTNLKKAGFDEIGLLTPLGSTGPQFNGYLNSEKNIICGFYSDASYNESNNYDSIYLECAKTDWTWLTDEEEALAKELEEAYYEKTGEYPRLLYELDAEVKNSQIEPYQTLEVSVGGAVGLFYRVSPDAKWQYLNAVQAPLYCSQYDTDDARKAFAGNVCYVDDTTESTVKP